MSAVRDLVLGTRMVPQFDYAKLVEEAGVGEPFHVLLTGSQRVGLIVYIRNSKPNLRASFHQIPGAAGKKGWKTVHADAVPYIVTILEKEPAA
jgi:hypothetical protein